MGYKLTSVKCVGTAYAFLILSVNFTSAGLLQSIREAAVPKDMDYKLPVDENAQPTAVLPSTPQTVATPSASSVPAPQVPASQVPSTAVVTPAQESNLLSTLQSSLSKLSSAIQERADVAADRLDSKKCKAGDILCNSGFDLGTKVQNQMSTAIIKTFGTMMSEMVNSTISTGMGDFMAKHGSNNGETLAEEHKAMVAMAANVLQSVSSKVIKTFTFFIQLAISGTLQNLLHQLMKGVTSMYGQHQKSMSDLRTTALLNSHPSKIPKPSDLQGFGSLVNDDPIQTLLNAGALTSLSYPGFDLMSNLQSNLFSGDTNSLVKKRAATSILTPYGLITNKKK
ncbi:hypothetical protein Ocin01_11513 [Orchesella cincta]|uniref:Uncharacterized protein n=1 Tax=Orchesella cincta TaxID=48709 RepID=A0A1D2MQ51_ORCCI|nr:hypothetical protein Ocin01_11513 [Orchesella cincta]